MTLLFSALCIIIAVIANFFGSVFARNITLPFYLDSVLTLAVTALCGLWAGLWSAITNAISGNVLVSILFASATSPNVDSSVQGIFIVVPNLTFATYYAGVLTNLTDKIVSAVVSCGAYKIGKKFLY